MEFEGLHYREEYIEKHSHKRYIPFREWAEYYMKISKGASSHDGFATPANPFGLGGFEAGTEGYTIHLEDINVQGVSKERIMAVGLAM